MQNEINIKIIELNLSTCESKYLLSLRMNSESLASELVDMIRSHVPELNGLFFERYIQISATSVPPNFRNIRQDTLMVLEKSSNCVFIDKDEARSNSTLKSLSFTKSNRLLIEVLHDKSNIAYDFGNSAKKQKFLNALDTLSNLISIIVYLPTDEQCSVYKRKMKRRRTFTEQRMQHTTNSVKLNPTENNNNTTTNNNNDYDDEDECDFG
jgi:hypothetical protein